MTRAQTVPPADRAAILEALRKLSDHAAALPDPLPLGRVLQLQDKQRKSRELLRVLAGHDDTGYFLDYYREDNDDEHSVHGRLRPDGTRERLENLEGQFARRVFPDPADTEREKQRIFEHNRRVEELLKQKGFRD